jgi:regulator of protease activity HflC (stomatin/prohibitin superfamily)
MAPDKIADVYNRFGGDWEAAYSRLVLPHVPERTKVVFGQYTAAKAISARGPLNIDTAKAIIDAVSYDPIFVIDSVQVEDIAFSVEYIKSVEARMMAEVEVSRFRQQLERERIQADIAVTQATGRANSVVAEAEAAAKAVILKGNAEAQAIQARGDALAKNPNLVNLVQAERWNGTLPTTMIPGQTVPLLNIGGVLK